MEIRQAELFYLQPFTMTEENLQRLSRRRGAGRQLLRRRITLWGGKTEGACLLVFSLTELPDQRFLSRERRLLGASRPFWLAPPLDPVLREACRRIFAHQTKSGTVTIAGKLAATPRRH